jgi:hypothetical protein
VDDLTELTPTGETDGRITPRTFDRLREVPDQACGAPPLLTGAVPEIEAPGVWSFVKGEGQLCDWAALSEVILDGRYAVSPSPALRGVEDAAAPAYQAKVFTPEELAAAQFGADQSSRFGAVFAALNPRPGVTKTPTALSIKAAFGDGLAAVADLGRLPPGFYELMIEARVGPQAAPGPILAMGVVGHGGLVAEAVEASDAPGPRRIVMEFETGEEGRRGLSLLLKGVGAADLEILDVVLR